MCGCIGTVMRAECLASPPGVTHHKPIAVRHPALGEHTFTWVQVYFYINAYKERYI